jgi:S-adenosylmethionine hydrolase
MSRPVITFLTDFGPSAPAVCRGVMYGICPDAIVIDISHQVPRYSIREGSDTLVFALPYMPIGIHVAVVDPGVGTERLPVAMRAARGDILIGPDNGLLTQAADALGGIEEARAISNRVLMLPVISASFHGRDIFSPVAAHLASGVDYATVGPTISIDALARLPVIRPTVNNGDLSSVIVGILIFGNATFAGTPADLEAAIGPLSLGRALTLEFPAHGGAPAVEERTVWQETFGRVPLGASLLYTDSEGHLAFADNQGNAAERLGLAVDRPVHIRPA